MAAEKKFELQVRKFLNECGVYECGTPIQDMTVPIKGWFFKHWGGGYSKSGIPDLICNINGVFVSVELKAPKGRSSELQKRNTIMINEGGGIGLILYPDGFDHFKELVKGVMGCNSHIQGLKALKVALTNSNCIILTG